MISREITHLDLENPDVCFGLELAYRIADVSGLKMPNQQVYHEENDAAKTKPLVAV